MGKTNDLRAIIEQAHITETKNYLFMIWINFKSLQKNLYWTWLKWQQSSFMQGMNIIIFPVNPPFIFIYMQSNFHKIIYKFILWIGRPTWKLSLLVCRFLKKKSYSCQKLNIFSVKNIFYFIIWGINLKWTFNL